MNLYLSSWMRELDEAAIQRLGIPSIVLMENAARGAAEFFSAEFPLQRFGRVLVVCGKGNNGGDGMAVARLLHQKGYRAELALLGQPGELTADARLNLAIARKLKLKARRITSGRQLRRLLAAIPVGGGFLVDAIFGTGLRQPLRQGLAAETIECLNHSGLPIAAIDIPSGLSEAFLPEEGRHIEAMVTAAFAGLKLAHIYPDGNRHCGKIKVIDIGIPVELTTRKKYYLKLITPSSFSALLARRPVDAHKSQFGHVLTICGSRTKPGAGILSAAAALKSGAGLVTAALPPQNRDLTVRALPELMTLPYGRPSELKDRLTGFGCVLAGPGLGDTPQTLELVSLLLRGQQFPLVLDADALNVLRGRTALLRGRHRQPLVLTPHPGEFSRLCGASTDRIRRDRIGLSRRFARRFNLYLILKGHHTLVVTPGGEVFLNQSGNSGMATAGSGDVLGGMIAGLIAQFGGRQPLETILQAAVFLHGYAGDLAAQKTGEMALTAGDILKAIGASERQIDAFHSPFLFA